jgi:[ribosomal protein S5]-alanine N-acetyltransferase
VSTPRLVGPRVALVPAPAPVATAVLGGEPAAVEAALDAVGLRPAAGWPHDDTAHTLLGVAEAGGNARTWLVAVDGEVVGECGWTTPPDEDGVVEVGYGLARTRRGAGLGTEAVALLLTWTEQQPGVRTVAAQVHLGNEASRRLLQRLGFVEHLAGGQVRAERGRVRIRGRHVC